MRIGTTTITEGRSAPHAQETRKSGRKAGAATTIPEDKETAALNAYEEHQRAGFETHYWDWDEVGLRAELSVIGGLAKEAAMTPTRERRLRAQAWAIERILKRREALR